jgi:protein-S-isoprenylcysteine O-methyltransferase Ste14
LKVPPRIIGLILIPAGIAYYFWTHPPNPWTWIQTLGVFLTVVGFSLWFVAHIQLGPSFTVSAQASALVTGGLYAKIRNPIYVFGLAAIAGTIFLLGRPYLLLVLIAMLPLQIMRARREGRALEEKFGEEYKTYRRTTWF